MNYIKLIKNGIVHENPIFVKMLALCPLLAVTTTAQNGVALGAATTFVMVCANSAISLLRKILPAEVRIATSVVLTAGFVTIVQFLMDAYVPPGINESLGIFIPLIVGNCMLFARMEAFASKNKLLPSVVDALATGIGFTLGLFTVGVIREFLGSGSIFGIELIANPESHMLIMVMAPGAFFTLGVLVMVLKRFGMRGGQKKGGGFA